MRYENLLLNIKLAELKTPPTDKYFECYIKRINTRMLKRKMRLRDDIDRMKKEKLQYIEEHESDKKIIHDWQSSVLRDVDPKSIVDLNSLRQSLGHSMAENYNLRDLSRLSAKFYALNIVEKEEERCGIQRRHTALGELAERRHSSDKSIVHPKRFHSDITDVWRHPIVEEFPEEIDLQNLKPKQSEGKAEEDRGTVLGWPRRMTSSAAAKRVSGSEGKSLQTVDSGDRSLVGARTSLSGSRDGTHRNSTADHEKLDFGVAVKSDTSKKASDGQEIPKRVSVIKLFNVIKSNKKASIRRSSFRAAVQLLKLLTKLNAAGARTSKLMTPMEALSCKYLRLTVKQVQHLEKMVKELGQKLDLHSHLSMEKFSNLSYDIFIEEDEEESEGG